MEARRTAARCHRTAPPGGRLSDPCLRSLQSHHHPTAFATSLMIQPATSLIVLSFVGAVAVSLIMLTIAERLCVGRRANSTPWFVAGSCAVGSGLWAMH